jgi:hypothetical protein
LPSCAQRPWAGCPWALGGPRLTWCVLSATHDPSIAQRPAQVFTFSDESDLVLGIFIDENSIFIDENSIFIDENTIILTADPVTVDKN